MEIAEIYEKFPTREHCLIHLENQIWEGKPKCPYCKSSNFTVLKHQRRYHCNRCNTPYSVTVKTIFHKTHVDLQKWLLAISLLFHTRTNISGRKLAQEIGVNKNTGCKMRERICEAIIKERVLIERIVDFSSHFHDS
ncbi:transposase [Laspinema palackyanum]|uniref:transposase n=1 Tax=Laspinema palackyanum TaxID=3231601 RepID=UPI00349FCA43